MTTKPQLGEPVSWPRRVRDWFTVGNLLLLLILISNGWRMYRSHLNIKSALVNPILSSDPDKFAEQIVSSAPPIWAWLITLIGVGVTLWLLWLWWVPSARGRRWAMVVNSIWLAGWLIYILLWLILAVVVVSRLLRFT